jgi:hypothetical protein
MAMPMPSFTDEERRLLHLALLNPPGEAGIIEVGANKDAHAALTMLELDGWLVQGPIGAEATPALREAPWNVDIAPELLQGDLDLEMELRRLLDEADGEGR